MVKYWKLHFFYQKYLTWHSLFSKRKWTFVLHSLCTLCALKKFNIAFFVLKKKVIWENQAIKMNLDIKIIQINQVYSWKPHCTHRAQFWLKFNAAAYFQYDQDCTVPGKVFDIFIKTYIFRISPLYLQLLLWRGRLVESSIFQRSHKILFWWWWSWSLEILMTLIFHYDRRSG